MLEESDALCGRALGSRYGEPAPSSTNGALPRSSAASSSRNGPTPADVGATSLSDEEPSAPQATATLPTSASQRAPRMT
jgi:hypothetical protein